MPVSLTNGQVRRIASEWHGGQSSALYALCSSGAVDGDRLLVELRRMAQAETDDLAAHTERRALEAWVLEMDGDRGPVDGWAQLWDDTRVEVPVTTRPARCVHCKTEVPLGTPLAQLAFYEHRGPGTQDDHCANCRYHRDAHARKLAENPPHLRHVCDAFVPLADGYEYDLYYCGCRGWD